MKRCVRGRRRISIQNRAAKAGVLVCAAALGLLLVSSARGQYLETTIKLPDTLGPMNGPYHLAWDEDPAHPRLYIGGEADSGGVIVAEAITCKRLARVSTGPVKTLYFVPPHRKLYVARLDVDSVMVVDCGTNQITSAIHTGGIVPVMQYNGQNDRLYCGGDQVTVIDCDTDTVVHTIAVTASSFAYDSITDKLYVGRDGPLAVIDCATDSVVASLSEVSSAIALCLNPTASKVYAATVDTLFAIRTDRDSVAARLPFDSLGPLLACDPLRNRIYCASSHDDWGNWVSIDCAADTILRTAPTVLPITFLACNTSRDRLYVFFTTWYDEVFVYDATAGERVARVTVDGIPQGGGWSQGLDRLYCLPLYCLCAAVDGSGDSIAGIVPLTVRAENIVLDTVHNRLYFTYGSSGCGAIGTANCAENVVTSYMYAGKGPRALSYNPNNDRLYWGSGGQTMTVYDCSTGSVVREVTTSGSIRASRLHLGLNKMYVYALDTLHNDIIDVVDCESDSVIQSVYLPDDGTTIKETLLVPEDSTLWLLSVWSVGVVDCLGDSVIYAAPDTLGTIDDAIACPSSRRVYTDGVTAKLWSINMDKPGERDTLHEWIPGAGQMRFVNIPGAHKAYWAVDKHLFVIDTRTNTLVDSFWESGSIAGMCLDRTGNFVYCAAMFSPVVWVIDARVDSTVATIGLPPIEVAMKNPLVLNRATGRIYVAQTDVYPSGSDIPVVRDSILIGLEELSPAKPVRSAWPSIVSLGAPLQCWAKSELWDATGRRAGVLWPGQNDIVRLAPGVYFVREVPEGSERKPQATRKVVIAE